MTRTAIYPGSFDPITHAHMDIIRRAKAAADHLIVAVLRNESKNPLFNLDEREAMVREAVKDLPWVEVRAFPGLLADLMNEVDATLSLRGLRFASDFEYELQMAQMNAAVGGIETIFMVTSPKYAFLSSSRVKEIAFHGRDVTEFVPPGVNERLREKFKNQT